MDRTSDTQLAAFLITQGCIVSGIDYSRPPRFDVIFANDSIAELSTRYNAGLARVDPIAYSRIVRKLNRIIRSQLQWEDD